MRQVKRRNLPGSLDARKQRFRLGRWFNAQFLIEKLAARSVLGQRRRALAAAELGQHKLAVRFFAPGIQRQEAGSAVYGPAVFAPAEMMFGERV